MTRGLQVQAWRIKHACRRLREAGALAVLALQQVDEQLKAITPRQGRPRGLK